MAELEDSGIFKIAKTHTDIDLDDYSEEQLLAEAEAELQSIKYNKNNYADEEFIKEYFEEKEYFIHQYKNFQEITNQNERERVVEIAEAYHHDEDIRKLYEQHQGILSKKK